MRCKHTAQGANDYYDDNYERYFIERDEAFIDFVSKLATEYAERRGEERLDIIEFAENIEEEFEFPDIEEWLSSEYEGMLGDCEDQAYEEWKDKQMGLND